MFQTALLVVLVVVALALIGLILIQQGKGADIGAAFGSGASNSVFGSAGSGNFITRTTSILAAVFFVCCLALAWYANHGARKASGVDFSEGVELREVPAAPAEVPAVPVAPADQAASQTVNVDVPVAPAEPATETPAVSTGEKQ